MTPLEHTGSFKKCQTDRGGEALYTTFVTSCIEIVRGCSLSGYFGCVTRTHTGSILLFLDLLSSKNVVNGAYAEY